MTVTRWTISFGCYSNSEMNPFNGLCTFQAKGITYMKYTTATNRQNFFLKMNNAVEHVRYIQTVSSFALFPCDHD